MKKSIFILPLFLAGCLMGETYDQRMGRFHHQCYDYGYSPGSDAFAQCMQNLDYHEEKLALERSKAAAANQAMQNAYNNAYLPYYRPPVAVNHQGFKNTKGYHKHSYDHGVYKQSYKKSTSYVDFGF